MIERYIASLDRRRLSPNTKRLRLFYVNKFSAGQDLATGTLTQLEAYVGENGHWSDNTRQAAVSSLRSFFKWAYEAGEMPTNPAADLLRIRVRRRRSNMASEGAIRHALEVGDLPARAMVLLGAECGLRVSEIANLNRSSRQGDWLVILGKGGYERSVFLSPELSKMLDLIEATTMRHGNYFPGRSLGTAIHPSTAWKRIRAVLGMNPHSLRHRAGTVVYRNTGNDIRTTQEFLGHASPVTTQIYVHVEQDDLIRASAASRIAA